MIKLIKACILTDLLPNIDSNVSSVYVVELIFTKTHYKSSPLVFKSNYIFTKDSPVLLPGGYDGSAFLRVNSEKKLKRKKQRMTIDLFYFYKNTNGVET